MVCQECNTEFEPPKCNSKYCTDKCRLTASTRRNYTKNRTKKLKQLRDSHLRLKTEVLTHYGPNGVLQCCWEGCNVSDVDVLSLDHVNNNGAEERKTTGNGVGVYRKVKKNKFPVEYQTLCMNHQWKKEITRLRHIRGETI